VCGRADFYHWQVRLVLLSQFLLQSLFSTYLCSRPRNLYIRALQASKGSFYGGGARKKEQYHEAGETYVKRRKKGVWA